jgi:hypothetical protein
MFCSQHNHLGQSHSSIRHPWLPVLRQVGRSLCGLEYECQHIDIEHEYCWLSLQAQPDNRCWLTWLHLPILASKCKTTTCICQKLRETTEYFDKIQNNTYSENWKHQNVFKMLFQNAFNFRSIYCFVFYMYMSLKCKITSFKDPGHCLWQGWNRKGLGKHNFEVSKWNTKLLKGWVIKNYLHFRSMTHSNIED